MPGQLWIGIAITDALLSKHGAFFLDGKGDCFMPDRKDCTDAELYQIRRFFIEFVMHYESENTDSHVKPNKMKGYVLGIQSAFQTD